MVILNIPKLTITPGPHLMLFLDGTGKNSHYVGLTMSETHPFQTNLLSQCDISSALVEFVPNEQFINSQ